MKKIILVLLVVSLSLSCLLISLERHSLDISHYMDNYDDHNIQEVTGKSWLELTNITGGLMEYLKGNAGDEILEPYFNEREILHMRDVQVLFKYGFILKYISLILSLILIVVFAIRGEKDLLGRYIYKGLFANWIIIGLLLIMIFFNFNKYFTYFHLIFFSNNLWLLDPETDLLIQMLPEEFFIDISKNIGLSFWGYVVTIQGIGYAATKKGRKKNEKKGKLFKKRS